MSVLPTNNFYRAITYPKELPIAIKSLEPLFVARVNFTDPESVRFFCGSDLQEPRYILAAIKIAASVYETPRRAIGEVYGYSFSINPEVLRFAMRIAKNETVLEIGAARGENTLLLAFSQAKEVYYNELLPTEVEAFKKMKSELPERVRAKLKDASGNFFQITDKCPEIEKKVGLVYCRNLLHFFNHQEMDRFFTLLRKVIRPNGKAIFTVNSSLSFSRDLYKKDPSCTSFMVSQCFYEDAQKPVVNGNFFYERYLPCESSLINSARTAVEFKCWEKQLGQPWKCNLAILKKMPRHLQREMSSLNFNQPEFKAINQGCIKAVEAPVSAYRFEQLSELFNKQGFNVLDSFAIGDDGHNTSIEESNWEFINQIGVVVQYPGGKA